MAEEQVETTTETAAAEMPAPARGRCMRLSTKLVALTVLFVVVAEILIFVPSIAHFRINRLQEALRRADLVVLALSDSPDIDRGLQADLLERMNASVISVRQGDMRRLVAIADPAPTHVDQVIDLGRPDAWNWSFAAVAMMLSPEPETLRVLGPADDKGYVLDLVMSSHGVREAMMRFAVNMLGISAALLAATAIVIFVVLRHLFLRPLQRLADAMSSFAEAPEDPERIIHPSMRGDEIGEAERRLAQFQRALAASLGQRRHLADLGVAVSKINHDLRNMLASAQLITDRLSMIPDSTVQRFVPKLVATLDRAIGYSRAVLDYGRTGEAPPVRRLVSVRRLAEDVGEMAGAHVDAEGRATLDGAIEFEIVVDTALEIDADPDQIFRVLLNLVRNARQALDGDDDPALVRRIRIEGERQGAVVTLRVADTGPGVPARAREALFRPFQGSMRKGGTGLGLAICAELVRAHGGSIELVGEGPGATFEITIADRVIDLTRVDRRRRSPG